MQRDLATAALAPLSAMRHRRPRPNAEKHPAVRKARVTRSRKSMSLQLMGFARNQRKASPASERCLVSDLKANP